MPVPIDPLAVAEAGSRLYRLLRREHNNEAGEDDHKLHAERTTLSGERTEVDGTKTKFHGIHEEFDYTSRRIRQPIPNAIPNPNPPD